MPELPAFVASQHRMADHLRDPENNPAVPDIEERRLNIYRELIYNNIESFLSSGFPILRSIISDDNWHQLARDFVRSHQSESPYFLEISQEFLCYLQEERDPLPEDPPFMLELAHYEWVELALDVSTETFPDEAREIDPANDILTVSPLAWRLCYQYPVHQIGPEYQPEVPPEQPTFLIVYRNRQQVVKFLEINALTSRLVQLLEDSCMTGKQALSQLAGELGHQTSQQLEAFGLQTLSKLHSLDILY